MTSQDEKIKQIIDKCDVCYIAMVDEDNMPYLLPFNFGFDKNCIYLHSAKTGKKIDVLKINPNVCIAFSTDHLLLYQNENVACSFRMKSRSVIAYGQVKFINDYEEKIKVLNIIMKKYTGRSFTYSTPAVKNVEIFIVPIDTVTVKESGY